MRALNEVCLRKYFQLHFIKEGFPCGLAGKESACNAGDLGLISGLGRSLGEGKCYPLQYSGLENFMDCIVHGVGKELDMTERFSLSLYQRTYFIEEQCYPQNIVWEMPVQGNVIINLFQETNIVSLHEGACHVWEKHERKGVKVHAKVQWNRRGITVL